MDKNISTWQHIDLTEESYDLLLDTFHKLNKQQKYLLEPLEQPDVLEQYLYEIAKFHHGNSLLDVTIEFSVVENKYKFEIEYQKKQNRYPLASLLIFMNEHQNPFLFTNIDLECYKYKEIPNENTFSILIPKKNSHVRFNNNCMYSFLPLNYDETCIDGVKCIKMNIWEKMDKIPNTVIYTSLSAACSSVLDTLQITPFENNVSETINYNNILKEILYENTIEDKIQNKLRNIINKYNNTCNLITIQNTNLNYIDFTDICEIYGDELAKDIFPFINENDDSILEPTNRFYPHKIITSFLATDICYWIINESERLNQWKSSPYPNYDNYLNVDKMPHILNFILFIFNFWKDHLYNIYNLKSNIKLKIKDIFVSKFVEDTNTNGNSIPEENIDNHFLILTIALNDITDYTNGEIQLEEDNIKLNLGDALLHNGKKRKAKGSVGKGTKFVLTLFLDIHR